MRGRTVVVVYIFIVAVDLVPFLAFSFALAGWLADWLSKFALFVRFFFISVSKLIFSFNKYTEHRDVIRKLVTLSGILMFFLLHRYIH